MKNPRFEDDAISALRQPDTEKIACKDCTWRIKDRKDGQGATLGICKVYSIKPYGILWNNDECPYHVQDG